jgi:hypothetical protein
VSFPVLTQTLSAGPQVFGVRVPGHAHRSTRTRMANSEQSGGALLLRWLNRGEVLVQLLLICLLECATIHNLMDVIEG